MRSVSQRVEGARVREVGTIKSKAKAQGLKLERSDIASGFKGVYPAGAGRFYANACRMKLGVFDTAEEVCTLSICPRALATLGLI